MNAQEARELTLQKRKDTDEIKKTIEIMAKAGKDFANIALAEIRDAEKTETELVSEGYKIEVTKQCFCITW